MNIYSVKKYETNSIKNSYSIYESFFSLYISLEPRCVKSILYLHSNLARGIEYS